MVTRNMTISESDLPSVIIEYRHIVGLGNNYGNSVLSNFTGEGKNVF